MKNTNKKGFTIVELVIVIAVIAILAAVLIPTFVGLVNKANESADIQALHTMNKYLAMEDAKANGKMELMDVYEALAANGIKAKTYTPLYDGRYYFYDTSLNRILYTDENYNVIAPEEHVGVTKSNNWRTLNGTIKEEKVEAVTDAETGALTYKVTTPEQLYYVSKNYSASSNTVVELPAELDLLGAAVSFDKAVTGSLKITGPDDGVATIKNFVGANQYNATSKSADGTMRNYNSAFIASVSGNGTVYLENLVFENCYVETPNAGNIAIVVGSLGTTKGNTIKNVTVKDSKVAGERSVGALVGMCYDPASIQNCKVENVEVLTRSGRSGIVAGLCSMTTDVTKIDAMISNVTVTNSTLRIWEENKTTQTTGVKVYEGETEVNETFVVCQKADNQGWYLHCDDALTWWGSKGAYTVKDANGETLTVDTYYLVK